MTVTYPAANPVRGPQGPGEKRAPLGSPLDQRERDVLELLTPKPPLRLTAGDRTTAVLVDPQQASAALPPTYLARRGAGWLAGSIPQPGRPAYPQGPDSRR